MGFTEISGFILLLFSVAYGTMILYFTFGLVRIIHENRILTDSGTMPVHSFRDLVSVIIPVRNESASIIACLESMIDQDYPAHLIEIIVSDDFSDDDTMELASRFATMHPSCQIIRIVPDGSIPGSVGKKSAISRAVMKASGSIILTTDADTRRSPGWISAIVAEFSENRTQMVLGPVAFADEEGLLQKIQSLEFLGLMGTTAGTAALGKPVMANGANLAYRRNAFVDVGGFTTNSGHASGDDQFFLASVKKKFGKEAVRFAFNRDAIVTTLAEKSLSGFLQQRIRWVSKSNGYRDPGVVAVALLTWLTHFVLLSGLVAGCFYPRLLLIAGFLWITKMLADYPMVRLMSGFFGKNRILGCYFTAQAFQLFYVVLVGMTGHFVTYRWKGRRIAP
jgi:cellulose synthase/poly-beta-1,6-N-acetylglucosamine synthase-like glycosyltransferase